MKKLILGLLLFVSSCAPSGLLLFVSSYAPSYATPVVLSTGASCEAIQVTVICAGGAPVIPPVVTPPAPPAPTPISSNYPGHDMWQYEYRRLSTGNLSQGQKASGGFTVPSGNAGQTIEFGISGANLNVYVDGRPYTGPFTATTGNHLLEAQAVNQSANGSIDVYHY